MRTDNSEFANWLESILLEKGMIPAELSRKSGIAKSAVSNILNNQRKPDVDTLIAFAEALQIPRLEIFTAAGYLGKEGKKEYREDVERFTHYLSQLDEEDKQILLEMARTIAERKSKYAVGDGTEQSDGAFNKRTSLPQNAR
jgi:transcriptional regulator with XRE-family HTH domain